MKKLYKILSMLIVMGSVVSMGSGIWFLAVHNNHDLKNDIYSYYHPGIAKNAEVVGLLFMRSFPADSSTITRALDAGVVGTAQFQMFEYLIKNQGAQENLFSAVLYDVVNQYFDPGNVFASIGSGVNFINVSEGEMGLDAIIQNRAYNNRQWGYRASPPIETPWTSASQQSYVVSDWLSTSPLVIDLNKDGILNASSGHWLPHPSIWSPMVQMFDIDADGLGELIEWLGPEDGFLIDQKPLSDTRLNGSNLFGSGDGWADGFEKLSVKDGNHDGEISGAELNGVFMWQDINSDAITQTSEVKAMSEAGITSIDLNHVRMKSSCVMDGGDVVVWDWYPNVLEVLLDDPDVQASHVMGDVNMLPTSLTPGLYSDKLPFTRECTGNLVDVTNLGQVILVEKIFNTTLEGQGFHWMLKVLSNESDFVTEVNIPLPVFDIVDVEAIGSRQGALIIANSGTKLLEVNFSSAATNVLYEFNNSGGDGFVFGAQSSLIGTTLHSLGTFHTNQGVLLNQSVGVWDIDAGDAHVIPAFYIDTELDNAGFSPVGVSSISANDTYLVVYNSSGNYIVSWESDSFELVDTIEPGTRFGGMWGAEDKLLYILGNETKIWDHVNGSVTVGENNWQYPVISRDGSAIGVALYDYTNLSMQFLVGTMESSNYQLSTVLDGVPIGPIRFSPNGNFLAYQDTRGIRLLSC
ncbi:MAG: hypothetical protein ACTSUE_05405 [Promethearchaeota archaeon]